MALLLVLLILVLGWRYTEAIPAEKVALKRSNNWESYVRLAQRGIFLAFWGSFFYILFLAIGFFSLIVLALILSIFGVTDFFASVISAFVYTKILGLSISEFCIVLFSFLYSEFQIKTEKQRDKALKLESLKQQDTILNLIIDAAQNQNPVKVSLKSRKVYIGIIPDEQFEQIDLDHLTIIPYYSGHRDKDTLQLALDHDYLSVYEKHSIYDRNNDSIEIARLKDFRLIIRFAEIESLSLFETNYYFQDFNP